METNQDSYPWGLKAAVPLQFLKNTVAKVGLMQIDFTNVAPHGILVLIFCPSALDSTCTPWPFTETVLSHHHTFHSLLQEILAGIHLCNFVFTDISKNIETAFYLPKHAHPTQRIPRLFPHTCTGRIETKSYRISTFLTSLVFLKENILFPQPLDSFNYRKSPYFKKSHILLVKLI